MVVGVTTGDSYEDGVGRADIFCTKGDTFDLTFTISEDSVLMNFTSYTAKMVVTSETSSTAVITFSTASDPATIVLGGAAGTIQLIQTAATMSASSLIAGRYKYDLQTTSSTGVTRTYLRGKFTIYEEVTTL